MDEGSHQSAGEPDPRDSESAKTPPAQSAAASGDPPKHDSHLPIVWSPKLDAAEEVAADSPPFDADEVRAAFAPEETDAGAAEEASESAAAPAGAAPARSSRFALLAAAVALAAATGSIVGSLSAAGFTHFRSAAAAAPRSAGLEANAMQAIKAELAELSALKASLDSAARNANGQFAKLGERLDRVEHAQIDQAKFAHMAEAIDRLEKKNVTASATSAAPEVTGSIANQPAAAGAKPPDKILQDWVVQNVRSGHALVENRYGGVFVVTAGSVLPGLGAVESVKRQDGQWMVVTSRGVITEQ